MQTPVFPRAALLLSLLLLGSVLVAPPAGAAPTEGGLVVNARTMATFPSVQAAVNAASPGDVITIPRSDAAQAVAYQESVTVPAALHDLTLCGTVAVGVCAPVSTPGRWESTTGATWGTPPVPLQGQALQMTGTNSTSHYPNSQSPGAAKVTLADVDALSVDFLLASGACGGGSPRFQLGVDTNGDGAKDGSVLVYPPAGWTCPAPNAWTRIDFANGIWDSSIVGGPASGTRAQALAAGGSAVVVTVNLVWDGSTGTAWFDNEQFNADFLREASDFQCVDPQSPSCQPIQAQPATILDPAGASANVLDVEAPRVTVRDLTVKNTGSALDGVGVLLNGASALVANATIAGPAAPCQHAQFGVQANGADATIQDSAITTWSHSGVDVAGLGSNLLARNVITQSCHSNVVIDGASGSATTTLVGNDLRQAVFQDVDVGTNRDVVLHENLFGLAGNTLAIPAHATGGAIDARYNHWGAYNRSDIEATFANDAGRVVDDSCYYTAGDASVVCGPTAGFTFSPSAPLWNRTVSFADASTSGGNKLASWAWSFGDAATATGPTAAHKFRSGSYAVTLTVTDAEGYASTATRTVTATNTAPTLAGPSGTVLGAENATLGFALSATDAENDALTYAAASALPAGATLDAATGAFSWRPSFSQAGAYTLSFTATDGDLTSAPVSVQVQVNDTTPPDLPTTITAPASVTITEGQTRTLQVSAHDPDGQPVSLDLVAPPAWATLTDLGNGVANLTLAPQAGDFGATDLALVAHTLGSSDVTATTHVVVSEALGVSVQPVGPRSFTTSPGATLALKATITNTGLHTDTYTVPGVGNVTLAPGESAPVELDLVVPAAPSGTVHVVATSQTSARVVGAATYTFVCPVTVQVALDPRATPASAVTGTVRATYANGQPVVGATLRVSQALRDEYQATVTQATTTSLDANGVGTFVFPTTDAQSLLPGTHDVRAYVTLGSLSGATLARYDQVVGL
jgi:hypothetical protein